MYKCECGKEFEIPNSFNGHKSHCLIHLKTVGKDKDYDKRKKIIGFKCTINNTKKREIKKVQDLNQIRTCECCKKQYTWKDSDIKSKKFCSKSCANTRIITQETKDKIQKSCKNSDKTNYYKGIKKAEQKRKCNYYKNPKKCEICNKIIEYKYRHHKTCCDQCKIELIRQKALNQKYHGYGKQGWYKGFWCDSTWELAYVIYCLDHNINIIRNTKSYQYEYNGKIHKYLPDFIVDNKLIEIKGYYTELVDIKAKAINDLPLIILYEKDMQIYFNWIKEHYEYNELSDLYDAP